MPTRNSNQTHTHHQVNHSTIIRAIDYALILVLFALIIIFPAEFDSFFFNFISAPMTLLLKMFGEDFCEWSDNQQALLGSFVITGMLAVIAFCFRVVREIVARAVVCC